MITGRLRAGRATVLWNPNAFYLFCDWISQNFVVNTRNFTNFARKKKYLQKIGFPDCSPTCVTWWMWFTIEYRICFISTCKMQYITNLLWMDKRTTLQGEYDYRILCFRLTSILFPLDNFDSMVQNEIAALWTCQISCFSRAYSGRGDFLFV